MVTLLVQVGGAEVFLPRVYGPEKAHFPSPLETGDIRHHVYRSSAMFSHLVRVSHFLASQQRVNFIQIFTQVFELSGEPCGSLVLELLSPNVGFIQYPQRVPVPAKKNRPAAASVLSQGRL